MGSKLRVVAVLVLATASACCGVSASPAGSTVALTEQDAGRTIQVRAGDAIQVALQEEFPVPGSSLVWSVTSLDPSVLQPGAVTRSPQTRSGPGGQDTYTSGFRALAAGQAVLDAHGTTTCEAMAKQNCPDRDFTITVVVSG